MTLLQNPRGYWKRRQYTLEDGHKQFNLEDGHTAKIEALKHLGGFKTKSAVVRWLINRAWRAHERGVLKFE